MDTVEHIKIENFPTIQEIITILKDKSWTMKAFCNIGNNISLRKSQIPKREMDKTEKVINGRSKTIGGTDEMVRSTGSREDKLVPFSVPSGRPSRKVGYHPGLSEADGGALTLSVQG